MLPLEEAVTRILAVLPKPAVERVPLRDAHGRILAQSISSPIDLPAFDNSAMDGYAVRAEDLAAAKPGQSVQLRLTGRVAAGEEFQGEIKSGECVRIFTGSPLPRGANAVVMQEDTRAEANGSLISVLEPVQPTENVRTRGDDIKRGQSIGERGENLIAGRLALLAATGISQVDVGRRPVVSLLATGSELKEPGEALAPGQIHESNRTALAPLITAAGGVPRIFPIVPDDAKLTRAALETAFAGCDAVITCGGVSVGEMDFVKSAFEDSGGRLDFWKVAIKPGRPFVFGQRGQKFLFGLPGNPVSAFVTFLLLVRPALLAWQGAADISLPKQTGTLAEPLHNPGARRHFVRVKVDARGTVRSAGIQASHILKSLSDANGLLDMPPGTTLPAGAATSVLRWD